jgi:hypothetical protein
MMIKDKIHIPGEKGIRYTERAGKGHYDCYEGVVQQKEEEKKEYVKTTYVFYDFETIFDDNSRAKPYSCSWVVVDEKDLFKICSVVVE